MLRFSDTKKDDDNALSEEQRFYYLRLMAKPSSGKNEPIKTKFVRWSLPGPQGENLETNHDLESQAMRVVRTIGQAFEVCHKVAQEQMQEKYQEDSECSSNVRVKNSLTSTEGDHGEMEEKLAKVSEDSCSLSSTDGPPPVTAPAYLQKRHHSTFVQQKSFDAILNPSAALEAAALATTAAAKDYAQASTSSEPRKFSVSQTNPIQQCASTSGNPANTASDPLPFVSGSSTLSHSTTWAPQTTTGQFQSVPTLDQRGLPTMHYYPMPVMCPSVSMPYGLSSPYLLSPYSTLPLPGKISEQQASSTTNPNIPGSPLEGQDLTSYQLNLSLDQYNQHLIRSQLDQAQQTVQVASYQVQLLRDQLTSETTARIEAQSRTHQLLNANRELLEQVQALVLRLQSLETKLAEEIQEQITQPSTSKGQSESSTSPTKSMESRRTQQLTTSLHEQFKSEAKVPGPPPVDPSKPYQLQSLADIRAGSLPPQGIQSKTTFSTKNTRMADDFEARTEPESGAEDTTDYSSSDQYEKIPFPIIQPKRLVSVPEPHLDVLVSNPQVLPNLSSFFSAQPSSSESYVPNFLAYPTRSQNTEISKCDEEQPNPSSFSRRMKERSGVLKGGTLFKRMSFNPKLWKDVETVGSTIAENIDTSQNTSRKAYEKQKGMSKDEHVENKKKKSDRLQTTVSVERRTSVREERLDTETLQMEPASLHLSTSMYPPRRMGASIASKARLPNRVSLDIEKEVPTFAQQQQPTTLIGNGPISLPSSGRQLANHIGALDEKEKLRKTNNSGPSQILILQEALKHGLASTKEQLIQTNERLDGMRGSLRYTESEKKKLGDPMVLAKLTKLPTFMSTVADSSEETHEAPIISGASSKSTNGSGNVVRQNIEAQKSDTGVL
ncbi:unnamed protein product [Cercopithifilaria johnstoni]|uniref:Uncharacterized protein n=1 Tax=Cercopithifilaria johnstoni TaxID=2874296 RepID=A0A8J2Q9S4_9BILA|nr:unnamed protein product [Cercopithifilaria johnstoni]